MKTNNTLKIILSAVFFTCAAVTMSAAQETAARVLPYDQDAVMKVFYYNPNAKKVEIKISDQFGLLYKETLRDNRFKKGFVKHFDLKKLKDGNYKIEFIDKYSTIAYDFSMTDSKIWVDYWNDYLPVGQVIVKN